ncbi:MAG: hypothetical protein E7376_02875 [Clostridiales bacterium]|nr:hypothetical protein [Clostridiales bacterium]
MFDYFCFSVPNLNETDFSPSEKDNENVAWIKAEDLKLFKGVAKANRLIVFNREDKKFYKNGKEINVKGLKIFPKCFIPYAKELLMHLDKAQANSIMKLKDYFVTEHWCEYFQPDHRPVVKTTYGEFKKNYKYYEKNIPKLFFKTVVKGERILNLRYGSINLGGHELFWTKPPIFNMDDETEIMLSPMFEAIEDPENKADDREYRAFIVNGKVYSLSRSYVDWPTEVPFEVKEYVENKVKQISKTNFCKSYVLDVTECITNGKRVIDVIEANAICSSGLEVCNDLLSPLLADKSNMQRPRDMSALKK